MFKCINIGNSFCERGWQGSCLALLPGTVGRCLRVLTCLPSGGQGQKGPAGTHRGGEDGHCSEEENGMERE